MRPELPGLFYGRNSMNRAKVAIAMAANIGKVLTPELAAAMARDICDSPDESIDLTQFKPMQCGRLTFQVEYFRDIVDEIHPLHELHWLETEKYRHGQGLKPDYDHFKATEYAGKLVQFTARADAKLVGNIRMYLYQDLHTGQFAAKEDTMYLMREYRAGRNFLRFFQYMEKVLKTLGVRQITTDSKVSTSVWRINEFMGYEHVANQYIKFL